MNPEPYSQTMVKCGVPEKKSNARAAKAQLVEHVAQCARQHTSKTMNSIAWSA